MQRVTGISGDPARSAQDATIVLAALGVLIAAEFPTIQSDSCGFIAVAGGHAAARLPGWSS